jgi:hypothetical protein
LDDTTSSAKYQQNEKVEGLMSKQERTNEDYKRAFEAVGGVVDYKELLETRMGDMHCVNCPIGRYCRTVGDETRRCVDIAIAYVKHQEGRDGNS